jgi:hypothetical protein
MISAHRFPPTIREGDRVLETVRLEDRAAFGMHLWQAPRAIRVLPGLSVTQPAQFARTTFPNIADAPAVARDLARRLDAGELATDKDMALWRGNEA